MANHELKVSVDITASLHKSLMDVLQDIADVHGITVENISVDWHSVRAMGGPTKQTINSIIINSKSERS